MACKKLSLSKLLKILSETDREQLEKTNQGLLYQQCNSKIAKPISG